MYEAYMRVAKAIADNMSEMTKDEISAMVECLQSGTRPELPYRSFFIHVRDEAIGTLIKKANVRVDSSSLKYGNSFRESFDGIASLVAFDHSVDPQWVVNEAPKRGYRVADLREMLSFLKANSFPGIKIAILGSMHCDDDGNHYFPVYEEKVGIRRIYEVCINDIGGPDWRFLFTKKTI